METECPCGEWKDSGWKRESQKKSSTKKLGGDAVGICRHRRYSKQIYGNINTCELNDLVLSSVKCVQDPDIGVA